MECADSAKAHTRVIAITNQKGGVGKTTTAVNLSAYLASMGQRVLMVDMDPQGNATSGVGIEKARISNCVYDVLLGEADARSAILPGPIERMDVMPSTLDLAAAEIEMASELSRENRLSASLAPLRHEYDFIVIDCPPALSLLTINSLAAAGETLIPIQCEYYALEGLVYLLRTIQRIKLHVNADLIIAGVLLTMFDKRNNLSKDVEGEVRREYSRMTFKTVIPRTVRLSEAPGFGKPIILYEPLSKGALAYMELAKEVVQGGKEKIGEGSGCADRISDR
ncbi:MAG: sporulation initiation inhibitor Soj [Candidatus Anoxymicrobium japonicum]|uniref:Sporulation initiation inhibitor Soj n=1 Tax=Candidatus Anoxymicrobium japonicum TaxID=2013648 RepID=A0A2N3G599_9ACTN|nr:MAG: sporulation initiation inhibitor Soj [Candidatus Anoxymicrobium japonicum]